MEEEKTTRQMPAKPFFAARSAEDICIVYAENKEQACALAAAARPADSFPGAWEAYTPQEFFGKEVPGVKYWFAEI